MIFCGAIEKGGSGHYEKGDNKRKEERTQD